MRSSTSRILSGSVAIDVVEDQLGVAEDGVERRAQLVAHVGEELRLVLARLRELAALVLDFVEQPHVLDRDHRLVGEGLQQIDHLGGKSPGDFRHTERPPKMRSARRSGTFRIALNPDFAIRLRSCGS